MRIKNVYKIAGLLVIYIALQSRMNGPGSVEGLQVTGAPGSTGNVGTCANSTCHTQGSFNPTLSMSVFDNGSLVIEYEPGKTYNLKLINSPIQGTPEKYGFQAVALNAANQQAGDWGAPGAGKQVWTAPNGRKYIEHSAPANNGVFDLSWVAPAAGTGPVTFYAASIAANGNSSNTGDGAAKIFLTIGEAGASSVAEPSAAYATMKVLPNPVGELLNLEIVNRSAGDYKLRFVKTTGEIAKVENVQLAPGLNRTSFGVDALTPGLYILQLLADGQHIAATQMVKR